MVQDVNALLACKDVNASAAELQQVLGAHVLEGGGEGVLLRSGRTVLALHDGVAGLGGAQVVVDVDSLSAVLDRARAASLVVDPARDSGPQQLAAVTTRDGHVLCLRAWKR